MRRQHHPRLGAQEPSQNRRPPRRQRPRHIPRHGAKRPGQNIGKDQIIRPIALHPMVPPAIRQPRAQQVAQPIHHPILRRNPHRPRLNISRQQRPMQPFRRRHGQNGRATTQIQNPPRPPMGHALKRHQATTGGIMLATAKSEPRIQHQHMPAIIPPIGHMGRPNEKPPTNRLLRKALHRARQPALGLHRRMLGHRLMARNQRRQRKRRSQRRLIRRLRPHRLQPPGLARLLTEIAHRRRHRLQRRLIDRHRLIRQAAQRNGLQNFGPTLHDFASTNRSSTFFNPAFSKEISSFSPSTPIIRP